MADPHHQPRPATALLIDIRDFTPKYNAFSRQAREHEFHRFLDRFYALCIQICQASFREDEAAEQLYFNSTGDGILAVFLDEDRACRHVLRAYLASLRLLAQLPSLFASVPGLESSIEKPGFGIGLESGTVTAVGAANGGHKLWTYLGHCINVAARLESLTKTIASASLILGEQANCLLTRELLDHTDYAALQARARDRSLNLRQVQDMWDLMRAANDSLVLHWLGAMNLKGVERPLLAFRSAPALLSRAGDELVARLVDRLGLPSPSAPLLNAPVLSP